MSLFLRRQLLASLALSTFGVLVPPYSNSTARRPTGDRRCIEGDSLDGVILAWEALSSRNALVDLWTARVSDIDMFLLPPGVRRITMWDDLFRSKAIKSEVEKILDYMPSFYGFDCRVKSNGMAFHLAGINSLNDTVGAACFKMGTNAVAIVDLDSCGVTNIEWHDVLPEMRNHYEIIVGVAHGSADNVDWLELGGMGDSFFGPSSLSAMKQCDFGVYTTIDHPCGHWEKQSPSWVRQMSCDPLRLIKTVEKLVGEFVLLEPSNG
jgi:hypothetical protein